MWPVDELLRHAGSRLARFRQKVIPGSEVAESIDVGRLICPLRYDLWVRIGLVRLLRDEWALYQVDFPAFLELAPARAYRVWYKEVACARFQPRLYQDQALFGPAFVRRVHETAKLWQSIDRNGFDSSTPIRLGSGRTIRTVNGKQISTRYFAGDGCHRVACLYVTGRTSLEPADYEVVVHSHFQPLDNTAILARHLPLDRITYLRFISRFYCDGAELDSADEILQHVAARKPELLPELESVLAYDLPRVKVND
jgi:hypothetical protein